MEHNITLTQYDNALQATLHAHDILTVDNLMAQFHQEISQLKQGDSLDNDRLRYYMNHFSYQMYRLRTIKARENLKASLSKHLQESEYSETLLNLEIPEGKKLIREEKMALAALETAGAEQVAILHRAVSNAIDERIFGLDKMLYNLSTAANLNMSEARLVTKGAQVI